MCKIKLVRKYDENTASIILTTGEVIRIRVGKSAYKTKGLRIETLAIDGLGNIIETV